MKKVIIFLILIFFISSISSASDESEYTPQDKFSRGIFNLMTFPFEIPINMWDTSIEENPVMGLLYGLPLGMAKAVIRFGVGIVEVTTFPFPPYRPIFEPEFLLFSAGGKEEKR